ncbi:MAG TPA: DUF1292 domain-containing protein [bacterium]|nr:DUF1292 domain-containing protein [bacterium]
MGEDEDVIKLLDEDGAEHEFSVVDVLDVGEQRYAILQPVSAGQDTDTAVIFRMEDEALVTIEDDAEFERVRQAFEESHGDEDEAPADDSGADHEHSSEDHGSTAH